MSSSVNEDQEQRKNTSMEDPKSMTIEFLRARLLSERSVSKSARQRADELAKRVEELEEQLKFVSLQRKKAEMATADVLAILEDHGISDISEEFDSNSDPEETLCESNSHNDTATGNEASTNTKVRRNNKEAYSSSEIESSPSIGRSLSWKSGKNLQYSLERKKYMDSARRRASFASTGSSTRRDGKSCRRIRDRETRSEIEESQNDVHVKATYCSDIEPDTSRKSSEHDKEKNLLKNPIVVLENHRQESNGHYFGGHGGDNDMERALQHQAQLIGQYEEEEKAQREWEEKFRESYSYTPDSCDQGNHSDVTEEHNEIRTPEPPYTAGATSSGNHHSDVTEEHNEIRTPEPPYTAGATSSGNHHSDVTEEKDEIKAREPPYTAGATSSGNQEMKPQPVEAYFYEAPQTSKSLLPSITDANKGNLTDQRCSGMISFESSAPEFSHPMPMGSSDQQFSGKHHDAPLHSSHQCMRSCTSIYPSTKIPLSHAGNNMPMYVSSGSPLSPDLAVMPQETFTDLGSVLEKLQQAKLSLKQNLNSLPLVPGGTSGNNVKSSNPETSTVDKFKIPAAYPGLFRLPTDNEFEAINRSNRPGIGTRFGITKISPESSGERFSSNHFVESRTAFVGDQFLNVPQSSFTEIRPGVSMQGSLSQPRLGGAGPSSSDRLNYLNPRMDMVLPSSSNDFYPFLPDFTLRLALSEGISRTFPSSELGVPPVTRISSYDDRYRPNMYR